MNKNFLINKITFFRKDHNRKMIWMIFINNFKKLIKEQNIKILTILNNRMKKIHLEKILIKNIKRKRKSKMNNPLKNNKTLELLSQIKKYLEI